MSSEEILVVTNNEMAVVLDHPSEQEHVLLNHMSDKDELGQTERTAEFSNSSLEYCPHGRDEIEEEEDDDDDDDHDEDNLENENDKPTKRSWAKITIGLALLAVVIFVIVDATTNGYVRQGVDFFLQWMQDHPIEGVFLFVLAYAVATVLFIPGALLTLGAGFTFSVAFGMQVGMLLGCLSVFVGASIGAIAAFLLGRYLLRHQAEQWSQKYTVFQAINTALYENGFQIFVLLRLSPIVPFNALNYVAGASSISLKDYVLALLGILPGTILYVFLATSAGSLADSATSGSDPTVNLVVAIVGTVFGVLAVWLTTRYARLELKRIVDEREQKRREEAIEVDMGRRAVSSTAIDERGD